MMAETMAAEKVVYLAAKSVEWTAVLMAPLKAAS